MSPAHNLAFTLAGSGDGRALAVQLLVLFATAATVATLFRRLKLEIIPGYLIAGAIVGPHALGLVGDAEAVETTSSLAVILLMFIIGMHLDLGAVRRGLLPLVAMGVLSTLAVTAVVFGAIVWFLPPPQALVVSFALAFSSTAVFVRIVGERREVRSLHGRAGIGIAIVQDLFAVIVMALLPPIARWAGSDFTGAADRSFEGLPKWAEFLAAGGVGLGGIAVMILSGRVLLPRILRLVARTGSSELVLVVSAGISLGAAIGAASLGFSPEMGAFLAGLLLAATPFRYQLAGQLAPMRDLLMAVFFTGVGMWVDPGVVADHLLLIVGGGLALLVVKTLLIGASSWLAGVSPPQAFLTGVYLNHGGEFSLVVIAAAATAGILSGGSAGVVIAIVILTLVVSPLLISPAHAIAGRLARFPMSPFSGRAAGLLDAAPAVGPQVRGKLVVIAGFGPVGRTLADRLAVARIPVRVIELNPRTVERHVAFGKEFFYGDVTNTEVLERAGVGHADAVILTIPDDETTIKAIREIRAMTPHAYIAARTAFLSGRFVAQQFGADHVTVEEVATAQAMEREVLTGLERVLGDRWWEEKPEPGSDAAASPAGKSGGGGS
ncbi:MAG: hypothetical protein DYG92_12945 [Leptolyngbya sp. PLA1]|nr:hypothetical protein [Leptolyngbya sp. PLA1]